MSLKVITEREGYHSPFESLSWEPMRITYGDPPLQQTGDLVWERLDTQERIALGYLLSKALGHPRQALDTFA